MTDFSYSIGAGIRVGKRRMFVALALIIAVLASVGCERAPTLERSNSVVYDRVVQRNELRVGYLVLPPLLVKETSTGKFSGIIYEFVEEMGRQLGLKVNWVEEVNLASMVSSLNSGKIDMVAFPLWRNTIRAKSMSFTAPLFYSTLGVYVRADDARFDKDLSGLNDEAIRVSTIDGEVAETIAKEDFPKAKYVALPQFSDYSQLLLQVQTGKADVTFFDKVLALQYLSKNPGKLKDVSGNKPIRVYAQTFIVPLGDSKFESMISNATAVMVENGALDNGFKKYGMDLANFYRVATPYEIPAWARAK